ncbi:unnamed protein product [Adineta steineri]|uniref:B box-type domain-containing protein n=1 Tax=Adineta steineri TaxID=433720 RepID=A0A814CJU6_9BILA|nr:unnamed protein product [Adineta steineri]CAF1203195.1 unnamed protein product [Adineta steineri]
MSNLQNATRQSIQTSMTNKTKSHALNNDLVERKTKALEGGLNKLKVTIQHDKAKPPIETNRSNSNKGISQNASHTPRDRSSVTGRSFSTKSLVIQSNSECGQCEKDGAEINCLECNENYCTICFDQFHSRGALQRHHYALLSGISSPTLQKKKQSHSADMNPIEISPRQANDLSPRRYRMIVPKQKSDDLLNGKTNAVSFQHNDHNKSKRLSQKHETITSINVPIESSIKLPNIDLNSSRKSSNEKLFTKTYRIIDKNNQATYIHRPKKTNIPKQQPKANVKINIRHSYPSQTIDIEHSDNDLAKERTEERMQSITPEEIFNNNNSDFEHERPITHVSSKSHSFLTNSSNKQDCLPSKSESITLFPQSLRSVLAAKSNDEHATIIDSSSHVSRSSSTSSEKLDQPSTVFNSSTISKHNTDIQSNVMDQYSIARFNLALDDIVDKSKLEIANQLNRLTENSHSAITDKDHHSSTNIVSMDSVTTISRRNSPFSFSNSFNKSQRLNSSSSRHTDDDEFFTEVEPQPKSPSPILPLLDLNNSTSNKSFIENLSHTTSNHSIILDETQHGSKSQNDNHSRPRSSLFSSSLSIQIPPSESDLMNTKMEPLATSSRKNSSTSKKNSLPIVRSDRRRSLLQAIPKISSSAGTSRSSSSTESSTKTPSPTVRSDRHRSLFQSIPKISSSSSSSARSRSSSSTKSSTKTASPTVRSDRHRSLFQAIPKISSSSSSSAKSMTKIASPTVRSASSPSPRPIPKHTLSPKSTIHNASSSTTMMVENKKSTLPSDNNKYVQKSIENNNSSNVHMLPTVNNLSKANSVKPFNRNKTKTVNNLSTRKKPQTHRQIPDFDDSKFNKLEFSLGDGLKWQEASIESMSSLKTTSSHQSSNPVNLQFAKDTSISDNDDDRSLQNVNGFTQHHSELDMQNSDENAILNEHLLNIREGAQLSFNEKNSVVFQTQLLDDEIGDQSSIDNESLLCE